MLCMSYFTVVGWPLGFPCTCGYLSYSQGPGLPEASSSPDWKLWLPQPSLGTNFCLVFLVQEHIFFFWCSQSRPCPRDVSGHTIQSLRLCQHLNMQMGVLTEEAGCCVGPEEEGGSGSWDNWRASWRSETQASSSRRGQVQVKEGTLGSTSKEMLSSEKMSLFLLKNSILS